ncbi:uncharacterized protein VTP21DRAFT_11681 [Calcarisporiella thermophila]|uniref:uncharacterized protein n=1 Tax=Calcarisporiella thermophila TaxID=911321 RepID=UPI003744026E
MESLPIPTQPANGHKNYPRKTTYNIGTRKSALALAQTHHILRELQRTYPTNQFSITAMSTTGDKVLEVALFKIGEKSLFTKELEVALLRGKIDFIVHSLKDLPTTLPEGLEVGAITERENPRDAVVFREKWRGYRLEKLPEGSVVGTSSVRRIAQLRHLFPHLIFKDIRGNVNTRLSKLDAPDGPYDAIILAVAGLNRLHLSDRISYVLEEMLPAVGQGALGIECRAADEATKLLLQSLDHPETRLACIAERALMRYLEGGCSVPIGVDSKVEEGQRLILKGLVASLDGKRVVRAEAACDLSSDGGVLASTGKARERNDKEAETLGIEVAKSLKENGAEEILNELTSTKT